MRLTQWLSDQCPAGDVSEDLVIAVGAGVARALASAWDCADGRVHGALSVNSIDIDGDGEISIDDVIHGGDRVAHQRDLRAAGRLLYDMLMNEPAQEAESQEADRVAAVLESIRASSLRRARDRVVEVHPVVGRVIARMLATEEERGFADGWEVALAFDNLAAVPLGTPLRCGPMPTLFEEDDPSDSTMFVALVRSGDRPSRAEPVALSERPEPNPWNPPAVSPPRQAVRGPPPLRVPPPARCKAPSRGLGAVFMCVLSVWVIGLGMGTTALWSHHCKAVSVPIQPPPQIGWTAELDVEDTGLLFEEEEEEDPPSVQVLPVISPTLPPRPPKGRLSITLTDSAMAHAIELSCPGGYRERQRPSGGQVSFTRVPAEACVLFFKGPIPARYQPVTGGKDLRCSIVGTTGVCS